MPIPPVSVLTRDERPDVVVWMRSMMRGHMFDLNTSEHQQRAERLLALSYEIFEEELELTEEEPLSEVLEVYELREVVELLSLLHDIESWAHAPRGKAHRLGVDLAQEWLERSGCANAVKSTVLNGLRQFRDVDCELVHVNIVRDAVLLEAMKMRTIHNRADRPVDLVDLESCMWTQTGRDLCAAVREEGEEDSDDHSDDHSDDQEEVHCDCDHCRHN